MLTYVIPTLGFIFLSFMYRIDGHLIIKNAVSSRCKRLRSLNEIVSTVQTGKVMIVWISLKLILQTLYISFLQYMNTSVRKLDRNVYEVSYIINGKMYKMVVTPKRGPVPVLQISDDEQNDVTFHVLPYMGPQYDWHGTNLTPEIFGYKTLTFELSNGTEHTYEGNNHVDYHH